MSHHHKCILLVEAVVEPLGRHGSPLVRCHKSSCSTKVPATTPPTIQIDPPTALVNTTLIDQTNSPLTLPSVTSGNSTNYFVVVTNNYGSVTSSAATLFVFLSPQNLTVQNVAVGLQMQFAGTPYYRYSLQSATNLTPPTSWISIFTNTADVNGNWQFTDTNLNAGQKFYRAEGQ